ncbi:MAG: BioY family transporter [Gammaproteobacteria bacterium]|nr:MAG: BioY family transporter [Gammaproteobacteria bacterium]
MNPVKRTIYTALFVALIACGAFIAIPIGPVPIVLQNMFVLLAGLILGPVWGVGCVAVYLFVGFAGLPVFAGGTAGIGKLFGPTGGYLLGYLPAVWATGMISKTMKQTRTGDLIALITGSVIVYAVGVPWLKYAFAMSWSKALAVGMYPFLIGNVLKIVAALFIAQKIRPIIEKKPHSGDSHGPSHS